MTATAYKSKKLNKYRDPLEACHKISIMRYIALDRKALAGNIEGYDVNLGDRRKFIRKNLAINVIRLVLN